MAPDVVELSQVLRESVIYIHDRGLWKMDLNGSNQVQIFPSGQ
jgi:hypothetical protein